ncbi:nitric oxide synthase 1-like isoform X2 [Styela clava]
MPNLSKPGDIISADICKRSIGGLGFLVRERRRKPVVIVSDIIEGGAAHDTGLLEVGDVVLKVNSVDLTNVSYQEALYALRAVKPGETATLLLRVRDGFTSRLETTFNHQGQARTVRITESSVPVVNSEGKSSKLTNGGPNLDNRIVRSTPNGQNTRRRESVKKIESKTNSLSELTCGVCLSSNNPTIPQPPRVSAPNDRRQDVSQTVTKVVNDEPKSGSSKMAETKNIPNGHSITNGGNAKWNDLNGNAIAKDDVVDATIVARRPTEKTPLVNGIEKPKSAESHTPTSVKPIHKSSSTESNHQPSYHTLRNWETGTRTNDTLYTKCMKAQSVATGCTRNKCLGSVMNPDHMSIDPRKNVRSKEEKLEMAVDFIKQYYGSMKRKNPEMEKKRLAEVVESIEKTGSYQLTEYELIFGAKTAWRNAPRCIGRIQWNKLQVFDYRHVDNTAQMFDAICNHLKYATNKGNIRSCITFFPQRTDYKKDFRVWSSQYIRYAGYGQPDGSIIGDPANVEFTEVCIKLGWKPKFGRFDILPLVLQANGEDPDIYEIPPDLALEVKLRHPRFKWFEELGYKWCAVPAVSNVLLDIGGLEFPAAPFNGWFMGTEIARDLCDVARYNVLQDVAEKMNLDTRNTSSLWKDIALVEFNVAVLHSYQSDRVTIMDHHSATQSFMKHYANELKLRGGCPGDWVWLTPPISGSITPIFHQEVLNYILHPSCKYQPDPWKYHVWKGKVNKVKKAIRFKELAKSVLIMSSMMGKAMANRVKATILYASETGKSLEYAKTLCDIFNHAFAAKVVCMDDYDIVHLEHETLLLVVTSTFGNGDPPENGVNLGQTLVELSKPEESQKPRMQRLLKRSSTAPDNLGTDKTRFTSIHNVTPSVRRRSSVAMEPIDLPDIGEATGLLANLRFAVFGLGSRAYPHFCAFAHAIDTLLGELSGDRLLEIGEGDELCGQEESFRNWAKKVFQIACETFCVGEDVSVEAASASLAGQDRSWSPNKFRIAVDPEDVEEPALLEGLSNFHKKKVSGCKLKKRTNLQSGEQDRGTILVEFDSSSSSEIKYLPGDHIGIYPCNQTEIVDRILERLHDKVDEKALIQLQIFEQRTTPLGVISNWLPDKRLPACTLRTAFERYFDITTCPTPQLLKIFADCAADDKEKARLLELSEGKSEYEEWKFHFLPNLAEVLAEFPSVRVEASLLLSQLSPLQCRYYSISSSTDVYPNEVHCTVAIVSYNTQGGSGTKRHGVCSSYLNRMELGSDICCFIRPATSFHLPKNSSAPCLLIGPGTGIAPFRSFWQQRMYDIKQGKQVGEVALLFGCRHPDRDHLYKDEIQEAKNCGAITEYHTAFSRLPGQPKQYVQHVLKEQLADLAYDWLLKNSGHVYICGDVTMADDVNNALMEVLEKKANISKKEAREHVTKMKMGLYLHEDVFGYTRYTPKSRVILKAQPW